MKTLALITLTLWAAMTLGTVGLFNSPCATEDSTLCYWDGSTAGNKAGNSYLAITDTISIRTK